MFLRGLNEQFRDELAARDTFPDLESFILLLICLDNRLRERWRDRVRTSQ